MATFASRAVIKVRHVESSSRTPVQSSRAAGSDGLRLWDPATGAQIGSLMTHDGTVGVLDLAFSRDGRWIATAGNDSTARLWDVQSSRQVGTSMPHEGHGQVTGVRFAGGSTLLLTTSIDGSTRVWNLPETALAGPPLQSASIVWAPDVSPDLIVATPTQGGAVDLWSITPAGSTSGTRHSPRRVASLPHAAMASVRFDATGRFLISAGNDGLVRVWDIAPALPAPPDLVVDEGDFHWRAVPSADGARLAVSSGGSPSRAAYSRVRSGNGCACHSDDAARRVEHRTGDVRRFADPRNRLDQRQHPSVGRTARRAPVAVDQRRRRLVEDCLVARRHAVRCGEQ